MSSAQKSKEKFIRPILDRHGRQLILQGLNASQYAKENRGENDRFGSWETEFDVRYQAINLGFNVVRFLIFWEGVMPVPRDVSTHATERYFASIERRLNWYADNHIHVILDMHQDNWSYQCRGQGAPGWASAPVSSVEPPTGLPFFVKSASDSVIESTDAFWSNKDGLQDAFADAWYAVASRFKDHPAVLGYDLLNEPIRIDAVLDRAVADLGPVLHVPILEIFGKYLKDVVHVAVGINGAKALGSVFKNILKGMLGDGYEKTPNDYVDNIVEVLLQRRKLNDWGYQIAVQDFEGTALNGMYQRVIDRIREVDQNSYIFCEPMSVGGNWGARTFLGALQDRRAGEPRLVYAPHLYPPLLSGYSDNDRTIIKTWLKHSYEYASRNQMSWFAGEIGATGYIDSVQDTIDWFTEYQLGWAYWVSDPGSGPIDWTGEIGMPDYARVPKVRNAMVTMYPRAVAGTITSYKYDRDEQLFALEYNSNGGDPEASNSVACETEIALPELVCPDLSRVRFHSSVAGDELTIDTERRVLRARHSDTASKPHRITVVGPIAATLPAGALELTYWYGKEPQGEELHLYSCSLGAKNLSTDELDNIDIAYDIVEEISQGWQVQYCDAQGNIQADQNPHVQLSSLMPDASHEFSRRYFRLTPVEPGGEQRDPKVAVSHTLHVSYRQAGENVSIEATTNAIGTRSRDYLGRWIYKYGDSYFIRELSADHTAQLRILNDPDPVWDHPRKWSFDGTGVRMYIPSGKVGNRLVLDKDPDTLTFEFGELDGHSARRGRRRNDYVGSWAFQVPGDDTFRYRELRADETAAVYFFQNGEHQAQHENWSWKYEDGFARLYNAKGTLIDTHWLVSRDLLAFVDKERSAQRVQAGHP